MRDFLIDELKQNNFNKWAELKPKINFLNAIKGIL